MEKLEENVARFHQLAGQAINEPLPDDGQDEMLLLSCLDAMRWVTKNIKAAHKAGRNKGVRSLRARLMAEELGEALDAMIEGDEVALADALVDLTYVTIGTAVTFGLPIAPVWEAVQSANMAKFEDCPDCVGLAALLTCTTCNNLGAIAHLDAGGKVVKPEGWTPPDVAGAMRSAGWERG